jgi:hypothetical protein
MTGNVTLIYAYNFQRLLCFSAVQQSIDPCNKPRFCNAGTTTADPSNCQKYFLCNNGGWTSMTCTGGTMYDIKVSRCNNNATCQPSCPETTGTTVTAPTLAPGEITVTIDSIAILAAYFHLVEVGLISSSALSMVVEPPCRLRIGATNTSNDADIKCAK